MCKFVKQCKYLPRFCGAVVYIDDRKDFIVDAESRKLIDPERIFEYINSGGKKCVAPLLQRSIVVRPIFLNLQRNSKIVSHLLSHCVEIHVRVESEIARDQALSDVPPAS